jgi:hypothetical protein
MATVISPKNQDGTLSGIGSNETSLGRDLVSLYGDARKIATIFLICKFTFTNTNKTAVFIADTFI